MTVTHEGGCLCGSVRYEVNGEPTWCGACHCRQCQRWTGTAFLIGAYFLDTQVVITSGILKQYEFNSDESGRWLRLEFCEKCGLAAEPRLYFVTTSRIGAAAVV